MATKNIEAIIPPSQHHFVGDGFRVHSFIPGMIPMERMDPFIMMDYNAKFYFPPTQTPRGVGVHPHRGFETVTIAYKGKIAHHDSSGGGGVIAEGDVQWMTAGSGVLHKEYHEQTWSKQGGDFHMVQLWVNLPAANKMTSPKYQALEHGHISKVPLGNGAVAELIAGELHGIKGAATTFSPIQLFNVKLEPGAETSFELPVNFNTGMLVVEGNVSVNNSSAPENHFVLFKNDGAQIHLKSDVSTTLLFISGEPLKQPIAAHGPFVMNTRAEIIQAFDDFHAGKFGVLED